MIMRSLAILLAAVPVAANGLLPSRPSSAQETATVPEIAAATHFHGIAIGPGDPSGLYLATHDGLYFVSPDGRARLTSKSRDDFMSFASNPRRREILYASGHPASGGNLGFIASSNGGDTWERLSDGVGGPVDFHQMDVSKTDPKVIYGVYGDLQRSMDGGRTWTRLGASPAGLIDLAASGKGIDRLYAATSNGLFRSRNAGRNWQMAYLIRRPATMVHVTQEGDAYAFIVGTGLVRATDPGVNWQLVSNDFGEAYVMHLAVDAADRRKLYVVTLNPQTRAQAVLASADGGAHWALLGND